MGLLSNNKKKGVYALLALVGILVMAMLQYRAVSEYQSLVRIPVLVSDIESNMLTLRRNEKDFLARKDLLYRQKFLDNYAAIELNLQMLSSDLQTNEIKDSEIVRLVRILEVYREKFLSLVELQKRIGFDHQEGLYGSLRRAIHQVEDLLRVHQNVQLSRQMLMLRRHEKDFMLRNDLAYIEKFDQDLAVMRSDLSRAYFDPAVKRDITSALKAYEKDFMALVSAVAEMGFSSNDGLHGEMRMSIHQSEDIIYQMRKETLLLVDSAGSSVIMQIMAFSLVLILLMTALVR